MNLSKRKQTIRQFDEFYDEKSQGYCKIQVIKMFVTV